MNKDKLNESSRSQKFFIGLIYIALIVLSIVIIVPVAWAFLAPLNKMLSFTVVLGLYQRDSTYKTLLTHGKRLKWATTCLTPRL
ncbi:hypothetical protein [Paenibacillus pini]|uniref:hypothetical protein n=1 Tax=Paenibacillus pini TaxID=669461 RepID=UPI00056BF937|nr:hypothetical protein [Paenibacillus pini]